MMVISSELRMGQYRDHREDHREDTPQFILLLFFENHLI